MAYADRDDVLARAGRLGGLFAVAGKRPDLTDVDELVGTVAAIMDAEILRRGYDPATLSAEMQEALKDVNAWAVLVRTLPEASPGDAAVQALVDRGEAILKAAGFPSLAAGVDVFDVLGALEAGEGGGGPGSSAGSLWDEFVEPQDWRSGEEIGEDAAPVWRRGQTL